MDTPEVGRTQQRLSLFVSLVVLGIGLAGCHGGVESRFIDSLLTRTDKFFDVAYAKGDTFVAVGYDGRILRTENAGQTWQEVESPVDWTLNQVTFVDDSGWAVGHRGQIIHTRDGGKTWSEQRVDTEKTLFSVSFVDKLHGWASGDESTLVWTNNGGESWNVERIEVSQIGLTEDMSLAVPDIIYYGIHFVDAQNGWMVGEYGNIRHTNDGGKTWDSQHDSLLDQMVERGGIRDVMSMGAFFRVYFTDQNNGIVVGAGGAIAVTNNGGEEWRWVAREGDNPEVPNLHLYDLESSRQDGRFIAIGTNGVILTSPNGGRNWQPVRAPEGIYTWINGIALGNNGKGVIVGGKGTVLLSDDAGQTWRRFVEEQAEEKKG